MEFYICFYIYFPQIEDTKSHTTIPQTTINKLYNWMETHGRASQTYVSTAVRLNRQIILPIGRVFIAVGRTFARPARGFQLFLLFRSLCFLMLTCIILALITFKFVVVAPESKLTMVAYFVNSTLKVSKSLVASKLKLV